MRLARIHGAGDVRLDEVAPPSAGRGDVVVRVHACGVCGSDLGYIAQGGLGGPDPLKAPLPIGHEFAGTVEAVGEDVEGVAPGMRVAVNPDVGFIGGGGEEGAMAPLVRVRGARVGETLFPLPDHLSFAEAALAEPLSVALHGLQIVKVTATDKVAVIGAGPIGLCAVVMLRQLGVKDIAIFDRIESRLERARALGADVAVNVERRSMADALGDCHGRGERFGAPNVQTDVFIDVAGAPSALAEAVACAKFRARVAVVALHKKPFVLDLWRLMANEILISGSIALDRAEGFATVMAMLAQGGHDLAPLISHRLPFERFHEALDIARDADRSAKVMLTFTDAGLAA